MRAAGVADTLAQAPGFVSHISGAASSGYRVIEVWESREEHQAWYDDHVAPNLLPGMVPIPFGYSRFCSPYRRADRITGPRDRNAGNHQHLTHSSQPSKEQQMPRILITHDVQDVERWLQGKAERIAAFPGGSNVTDLVAADGSNRAAVVAEVDDLDAFNAFMASPPPEMAAQAESHGVVMPTAILYVEA
jgi:heme-degrading monooxygenase HmoA